MLLTKEVVLFVNFYANKGHGSCICNGTRTNVVAFERLLTFISRFLPNICLSPSQLPSQL